MSHLDPRNVCDGCSQSLGLPLRPHVELGPIVHDHIWQQLADDYRERLCFTCMGTRAVHRLGRKPMLVDLRPCRWNLFYRPHSWLDLFVKMEGTQPSNLAEWRDASEKMANPVEELVMDRPRRGLKALSPVQFRVLARASTTLKQPARAAFVEEVTAALRDKGPVIGDGDLHRAVRRALRDHRDERRVR